MSAPNPDLESVKFLVIAGAGVALTAWVVAPSAFQSVVDATAKAVEQSANSISRLLDIQSMFIDLGFKGADEIKRAIENSIDIGAGSAKVLTGCPSGYRDDGLSCFYDLRCDSGGCKGPDLHWKQLYCPSGKDDIAGLCYNKCPPDYPRRVPGMPYLCRKY